MKSWAEFSTMEDRAYGRSQIYIAAAATTTNTSTTTLFTTTTTLVYQDKMRN